MKILSPETIAAINAGIAKAEASASADAKTAALIIIKRIATKQAELMIDDVQKVIELIPQLAALNGSFLGPRMLIARDLGWITNTGRKERSDRAVSHGVLRPVWKSNIYTGGHNGDVVSS